MYRQNILTREYSKGKAGLQAALSGANAPGSSTEATSACCRVRCRPRMAPARRPSPPSTRPSPRPSPTNTSFGPASPTVPSGSTSARLSPTNSSFGTLSPTVGCAAPSASASASAWTSNTSSPSVVAQPPTVDRTQTVAFPAWNGSTKCLPADQSMLGMPFQCREQLVFRSVRKQESTVRVAVRFRPHEETKVSGRSFRVDAGARTVESDDKAFSFELDHVFDQGTPQERLYECVGQPIISDVLAGYNGTIFAYGQTGSGKTFSMFGPSGSTRKVDKLRGIIPRAAEHIFDSIHASSTDVEYVLRCSLLEVYKEQMRDLLNPANANLRVIETPSKGVVVEGLSQEFAVCGNDILDILELANRMRAVACTQMNSHSSRSHVIFMLACEQKLPDGTEKVGKLNLVDLAGSEKAWKSGLSGETLEEAKKINLSLSSLGNVIHALADKRPHVPYRDSKLTRVLQETLGGNFKTSLVITCSSSPVHFDETLSSLHFATRAKAVCNHVKMNFIYSSDQLMLFVKRLRRELALAKRESGYLSSGSPSSQGSPSSCHTSDLSASAVATAPVPIDTSRRAGDAVAWERRARAGHGYMAQLESALEAQGKGICEAVAACIKTLDGLSFGSRRPDESFFMNLQVESEFNLRISQHIAAKHRADHGTLPTELVLARASVSSYIALAEEKSEQRRTGLLDKHRYEAAWPLFADLPEGGVGGVGGGGHARQSSLSSGMGWSPHSRPRPPSSYLSPSSHRGSRVVRPVSRSLHDTSRLSGASGRSSPSGERVSGDISPPIFTSPHSDCRDCSGPILSPQRWGTLSSEPQWTPGRSEGPDSAVQPLAFGSPDAPSSQRSRMNSVGSAAADDSATSSVPCIAESSTGGLLDLASADQFASSPPQADEDIDASPRARESAIEGEVKRLRAALEQERQFTELALHAQHETFQGWMAQTMERVETLVQRQSCSDGQASKLRSELESVTSCLHREGLEADAQELIALRERHRDAEHIRAFRSMYFGSGPGSEAFRHGAEDPCSPHPLLKDYDRLGESYEEDAAGDDHHRFGLRLGLAAETLATALERQATEAVGRESANVSGRRGKENQARGAKLEAPANAPEKQPSTPPRQKAPSHGIGSGKQGGANKKIPAAEPRRMPLEVVEVDVNTASGSFRGAFGGLHFTRW